MRSFIIAILLTGLLAGGASGAEPVIRSVPALCAAVRHPGPQSRAFDIEAVVTDVQDGNGDQFTVTADGANIMITDTIGRNTAWFHPGDRIRARGTAGAYPTATKIDILGHGDPPPPQDATLAEVNGGTLDNRLIRTTGTLIDVFRDEIDPRFIFMVLSADGEYLYLVSWNVDDMDRLIRLKGAVVRVTGFCRSPSVSGRRRSLGRTVNVQQPDGLQVIRPAPADPFDVPDLQGDVLTIRRSSASDRPWRKVRGTVIAVRPNKQAFLQTSDGSVSKIQVADGPMPDCGAFIESVGRPETDVHHLNLSRAIWRAADGTPAASGPAERVTARFLLTDGSGRQKIKPGYHGRLVTLSGTVQHLSSDDRGGGTMTLLCDGFAVPVETSDASGRPADLTVGCEVEVTGVCIMEMENWRPQMPFPVITGVVIVQRSPTDVVILSHPSKWTAERLRTALGILVAAFLGILVWCILLKRLSDRKGRELADAALERAEAELKVHERTRLATELHDTIAQNLTGASMELRAADRTFDSDGAASRRQLALALRTIDACRDEIRDCIWDLRNQALDERLMDDALRRTLEPHLAGVRLAIRFAVPRNRLTDNTAHAILCIVRELAINAVRHGHAGSVRVAGCIEDAKLLFSVSDDGCGFDPKTAPGGAQGHFGLQGIGERVDLLHGTLVIASEPGAGTKVSVSIPMVKEGRQ